MFDRTSIKAGGEALRKTLPKGPSSTRAIRTLTRLSIGRYRITQKSSKPTTNRSAQEKKSVAHIKSKSKAHQATTAMIATELAPQKKKQHVSSSRVRPRSRVSPRVARPLRHPPHPRGREAAAPRPRVHAGVPRAPCATAPDKGKLGAQIHWPAGRYPPSRSAGIHLPLRLPVPTHPASDDWCGGQGARVTCDGRISGDGERAIDDVY